MNEVNNHSKKWNQEVFGNIFCKKHRLEARIHDIQRSPLYNEDRGLQKLEAMLIDDLNSVLWEEDILWFQKSHKSGIEDGNRNIEYYHRAATIRRNYRQ
nr:uncharacterized protein LOC109159892 [Ipomoea trifida]